MTRAIPAGLAAVLAGSPVAGECLVLQARDGDRARFTTLDMAQAVDLGLGAGSESCSEGMTLAALTLSAGVDASHFEARGALGSQITRAAIDGGKWDDARAWLVRLSPDVAGEWAPLLAGKVREARIEGPSWVIEVRSQADALNQTLGRELRPYCDAELGDVRCGYALVPVAATVAGVTDGMRLTLSYSGTYANDFFNLGRLTFTSGVLDGVTSEALFDWTSLGVGLGSAVLRTPLAALPAPGDTAELRQGCGKTRSACMGFNNMANFRGEPDVPGSDSVMAYQVPQG